MFEIACKILFFLSMLIVYANVTSAGSVIVIVLGYVACVFSYYYFNNIQGAIDEWLSYFNVNARLNDTMNPSQVSGYFVNKKYNKLNNNSSISSVGSKKIFSPLCNSENTLSKENSLLENYSSSIVKPEFKNNSDLPSPIMKNGSPLRNNRFGREKLKVNFNSKTDVPTRKNIPHIYNTFGPMRRCNANWDLETYMNVNSPGFTSRVVDKATESASYHLKYPAVRQISAYRLDKSTARHLSKLPKANSTPAVRIAPPESATLDILNNENLNNETNNDDVRSNNFLQVLKDISRKRNYSQEETDRTGSTPKKSRKTDVKNVLPSQYKRAHEDCSNDSAEDKSRKKRCDDNDRNYAKMMSFTSSMSVLAPEFSWNNHSKKRKSSKLEKCKNESPEKLEKFRKIGDDIIKKKSVECDGTAPSRPKNNATYVVKLKESEVQTEKDLSNEIERVDEMDSKFMDIFPNDDDGEYVRVASGKILNRTNCTYRKKLNSTKIDPISVIATEPEYISKTSYIDDKTMKENLLKNLIDDVERKGEKKENVIFYQNSIIEEIEKKVSQVEVQDSNTAIHTSASFNPLLPLAAKPSTSSLQFGAPVVSVAVDEPKRETLLNMSNSSALFLNLYKPNSPPGINSGNSCSFNASADTVDSPKSPVVPIENQLAEPVATKASFDVSLTSVSLAAESTSVITCSNKTGGFTFTSISSSGTPTGFGNDTAAISSTASASLGSAITEIQSPAINNTCTEIKNSESSTVLNTENKTAVKSSTATFNFGNSDAFKFGLPQKTTITESNVPAKTENSSTNIATSGTKHVSFGNTEIITFSGGNSNISDKNDVLNADSTSPITLFGNTPIGTTSSTSPFTSNVSVSSSVPALSNLSKSTSSANTFQFGQKTTSTETNPNRGLFNLTSSTNEGKFKFGAPQPVDGSTSAFGSTSNPSFSSANEFESTSVPSFGSNTPTLSFNPTTSVSTFSPDSNTGHLSFSSATTANSFNSNTLSTFGTTAQNSTFGFGTQSSAFGTNNAPSTVFGSMTQTNTTQPSLFGSTQTNVTPSSVFGENTQTNASQPLVFGGGTQCAVQPSVFGSNSQSPAPPSLFGAPNQHTAQSSVFGSTTSQVNTGTASQTQPSLFGAGDNSTNVFGQNQATAPPVGVVNPLPQTSQFGSGTVGRFAFGATSQTPAFGSTSAAPSNTTPFGGTTAAQSAFNTNTPSFSFSGSSTFGAGTSAFGSVNSTQQGSNSLFNFGSSNAQTTQQTQPSQTAFQFGAGSSLMPTQPFMFGAGAAPAANTGGFSIGTGGSSARSRAVSRLRKTK